MWVSDTVSCEIVMLRRFVREIRVNVLIYKIRSSVPITSRQYVALGPCNGKVEETGWINLVKIPIGRHSVSCQATDIMR